MKKFLPLIFFLLMLIIAINKNKQESSKIQTYKIEIKNEKQHNCKLEVIPEIDFEIYKSVKSWTFQFNFKW